MKKLTHLLMMLCVFAGTAWAGPTDLPQITTDLENPIYYTIYNTRSTQPGGLMYYAGDEVGMKDGCTSPTLEDKYKFYFTGSHDALYVHNAATTKKLASVGNGDKSKGSWTDEGTVWAVGVSPKGGGLAFGPQGGLNGNSCWNECNYDTGDGNPDFTTWSANDAGSIFVVELASEYTFPETDKFYTIECPLFESVQGVKKGLYVTAEDALAWGTVDLTNKNHYWVPTVDAANATVALKNLGTGKYLNGTDMADAVANATIKALGSNQFNIVVNSTTVHADGHDSGNGAGSNIVSWGGALNSASAWTFVEQADPDATTSVTIRYSFTYNGVEKYTQETSTLVGQDYPAITTTFPFGVSAAAKPEGTIPNEGIDENGVKTVEITLSVNLPFVPATDNTSIKHWYFLSIKGNKLICYVEGQSAIDLNVTSVPSTVDGRDACTWAFVGNPFDGYKLYNKKAGSTMILSSSTTMTGQEGSTTYPILTEETTVPEENNTLWFATKSTHQTNGFFLAQNGFESNRMNDRGNILAYWTGGADNGSTFTVSERDFTGITELEALVNKVKAQQSNYVGGTEVGLYTQATVDAVSTAIAAADAALAGEMTEAISLEHQTAINTAVEGLAFNAPVKGKFYRLKNVASDNYMSSTDTDAVVMLTKGAEAVSTIFYLDEENKLLSYNKGLFLDCGSKKTAAVGTSYAGEFAVAYGGATAGVVTYINNGYWTFGNRGDGVSIDRGQNTPDQAGYNWTLEEVEWLPVPMNVEAGYATLYSPVALSTYNWKKDGHRVEAYTGVIDGEKLSLTRIDAEDGIIPANTPVVLKYVADAENGNVFLQVSDSEKAAVESYLKGTLADIYITDDSYVLSRVNDVVGFYKATMNQQENTAFLNNGFKAYLPAPTGAESRFLVFNFGDDNATAIEGIEVENTADAVVYDLAGRRVQKAQKGLYIVNGKKVIK